MKNHDDTKTCSKCGAVKPRTEEYFYKHPTTSDELRGQCKECMKAASAPASRAWRAANPDYHARYNANNPEKRQGYARRYKLKQYGITPEDYDRMLEEQGGVCAICKDTCTTGWRLAVDHCHATGKVRGLLCQSCNTALGKFEDNIERMKRAADYLRCHDPSADTPE